MLPYFLIILFLLLSLYLYWRFWFFYRDPDRNIPEDNNIIVAPADGTIVYVRKVKDGSVPISIKKKKEIRLDEISKVKTPEGEYYIVGIFMHPTSVHVNRSPIRGTVEKIVYTKAKNLPMTLMWWRVLLGMRPYELYSGHVFSNERNTVLIKGDFPVYVVQIADIYVNKIECWVKEGDHIDKGQRFGMIKMGSQVDLIFPTLPDMEMSIVEGQDVKAGETIITRIHS